MVTSETHNKDNNNVPAGASHDLQKISLKTAGFSFMLADLALIIYGFATGEKKIGRAGILGLMSGGTGAVFGNPKAEKQLALVERHLGAYLRRQGVEIPKDPTLKSLTKKDGVIDHALSFLYTYPSQIMTALYTLVGVEFFRSGRQKNSNALIASGCLLMAGALGGLLINEKKPNPEQSPQGVVKKALGWIQEKPLRLTGTLFTANNVLLTIDAIKERNKNPAQKSYLFKILAAASFAFGNAMMGLSSKSAGGGARMDTKTLEELASVSAKVIAAQPKEVRNAFLEHVADFLSTQSYVHMSAMQVSEMLHKKLDEMISAPPPTDWQSRINDAKGAQPQPSL